MNYSLLSNLQLNKEQVTLSRAQQKQLLEVIGRLIFANFRPSHGSILIIRAWADGTYEQILSGDLSSGVAERCYTQALKDHPRRGLNLVNDMCGNSAELVGWEVSEALGCEKPGAFYYGKINPCRGSLYAEDGHYVLSLPLDNGRIIAAFRASYSWRKGGISSCVSEPWQHRLFLASLAETLHRIMPRDQRLADSYDEIMSVVSQRNLSGYKANSDLIANCLSSRAAGIYQIVNLRNSKVNYA